MGAFLAGPFFFGRLRAAAGRFFAAALALRFTTRVLLSVESVDRERREPGISLQSGQLRLFANDF